MTLLLANAVSPVTAKREVFFLRTPAIICSTNVSQWRAYACDRGAKWWCQV